MRDIQKIYAMTGVAWALKGLAWAVIKVQCIGHALAVFLAVYSTALAGGASAAAIFYTVLKIFAWFWKKKWRG